MSSIFSVDDFPELIWQAAPSSDVMSRSTSEWELDKFLHDFPNSSSSSSFTTAAATTTITQHPSLIKPSSDDVVEIHPLPPPSKDTESYHAFLKSQLDLACAAAAKSRDLSVKPEGVSPLIDDQRPINNNKSSQSGSSPVYAGNGHGISKGTSEGDGGSIRLPSLPSMSRKQEVPVRQATSGSSRDDSDDDELDGDIETNDNMDPADDKRARRMQSNRESARRSRRRKQAQLNELEAQVGQLRDERTSLLTRLTDINKKCDDASVDNRILNANIETLRTKVKMAEDQVKRVTGLNPMVLARSNMPSMGMHFVAGQTDASANIAVPVQQNNSHFFHHSADINPGAGHLQRLNNSHLNNNLTPLAANLPADNGTNNIGGGLASVQPLTGGQNTTDVPPLHHVPKLTGPTMHVQKPAGESASASPAAVPISNTGPSQGVGKDNKKN